MSDSRLERRAFLTSAGKTLASAGALGYFGAGRASAGAPGAKVFEGRDVFERLLAQARERRWSELPIGERIGAVGLALRQTPYVASTLELYDDREVCSVDFRGLDCVTFFELALALARMLRRGERTPEALLAEVTFLRYRGGQVTDYASRLHYLSDWFFDNQAKRVVRLITPELPGAARFTRKVDFMSTHPGAYRQLKASPDQRARIARREAEINARVTHYVPRDKVAAAQRLLLTGDIIGVTTTIDGLDCAHSGVCYRDEAGIARFLHASTTRHAVVLDDDVATYVASVPTHSGVMVVRPLEVR
ncbi:MAG: N-acetylmuramoyl-L-alanine amidase-like domain-containing protein [Candidatus Rokuibacteriota bacterium]